MAMHTQANKILTDAGYRPGNVDKTYRRGVSAEREKVREAAQLLAQALTDEGLMRIIAPLRATQSANPAFALGDGPKNFIAQLDAARKTSPHAKIEELQRKHDELGKELAALKAST